MDKMQMKTFKVAGSIAGTCGFCILMYYVSLTLAERHIPKIYDIGKEDCYAYHTLREGIGDAIKHRNSTVYVHEGIYDLKEEFKDVIEQQNGSGILLANGVHVIFMAGSKVVANFDTTSQWVAEHFEPFYVKSDNGDFTVENLNIESSNCRYCIHDECSGNGTYTHKYLNCQMSFSNTYRDAHFVDCIGGGLGEHGTIIIDGGSFKTYVKYGNDTIKAEKRQITISFHNGIKKSCESFIVIKNIYLKDKGRLRFGCYGDSKKISNVLVSGCNMEYPIWLNLEQPANYKNQNIQVIEWNNVVRDNQDHPSKR